MSGLKGSSSSKGKRKPQREDAEDGGKPLTAPSTLSEAAAVEGACGESATALEDSVVSKLSQLAQDHEEADGREVESEPSVQRKLSRKEKRGLKKQATQEAKRIQKEKQEMERKEKEKVEMEKREKEKQEKERKKLEKLQKQQEKQRTRSASQSKRKKGSQDVPLPASPSEAQRDHTPSVGSQDSQALSSAQHSEQQPSQRGHTPSMGSHNTLQEEGKEASPEVSKAVVGFSLGWRIRRVGKVETGIYAT